MSKSVNKKYKYTETIEHQDLEALTSIPVGHVQNTYKVFKKR